MVKFNDIISYENFRYKILKKNTQLPYFVSRQTNEIISVEGKGVRGQVSVFPPKLFFPSTFMKVCELGGWKSWK